MVPKIPSYRILDLVEAIGPNCEKEIIGIRPGEKLHEEMITISDSTNTLDMKNYFSILPTTINNKYQEEFNKLKSKYNLVKEGFYYSSNNNLDFLTVEDLRKLIKEMLIQTLSPYKKINFFMDILLVGGFGKLGSFLQNYFKKRGFKVGIYGRSNSTPIQPELKKEKIYSNLTEYLNFNYPDLIINLAALTNVDKCEIDKNLAYKCNIEPFVLKLKNLL